MKVFLHRKGFTLIEILVVAALISLFAAIAMFNIQRQFMNNLKKTVMGEVRNMGMAYEWALKDVGFFPKPCFLDKHVAEILPYLDPATYQGYGFDYIGHPLLSTILYRVKKKWNGPYFASSQSRNNIAQGRGGNCRVLIRMGAGAELVGPFLSPCDPYANPFRVPQGSPYVLYLLKVVVDENGNPQPDPNHDPEQGEPQRFQYEFITDPLEEPAIAAVVSYGRNGVPGGPESLPGNEVENRKKWRLFTEATGGEKERGDYVFRAQRWFETETGKDAAMKYFDLITQPDTDDIIYVF